MASREIPLFPLRSVLFPGAPISLHIFEERYRTMVERCLQDGDPFGVVLIRRGVEARGPLAEPHPIGCTARISRVEPLEDGRMHLVAVGEDRFRISQLHRDRPYLHARVEIVPHRVADRDEDGAVERSARKLRPLVQRYLLAMASASEARIDDLPLPRAPLELAYMAAFVLQVPPPRKQPLLAVDSAARFVERLYDVYRHEVPLMQSMVARREAQHGPFSRN